MSEHGPDDADAQVPPTQVESASAASDHGEQPPRTGDTAVDGALAAAAAVQDRDPAEQLETYVGTHRALQDRLADSGA